MLGADVGTSLMSVVFSFDLSWLSPLLIFTGVVLFLTRESPKAGRFGRILIGLGLMLLALQLVVAATEAADRRSPAVQVHLRLADQRRAARNTGRRRALDARVFEPGGRAADRDAGRVERGPLESRWAWCSAPTWAAACWRCSPRALGAVEVRQVTAGQLRVQAARRAAIARALRRPVARGCARSISRRRPAGRAVPPAASTWSIALGFIGFTEWIALARRTAAAEPEPDAMVRRSRTTSILRRWRRRRWRSRAPRARRCTRPTWSRPC